MLWHAAAWALVALATGFGCGWQVRSWKAGADAAAELRQANSDALRRVERANVASGAYEASKAAREVRDRTRSKEVGHALRDPVFVRECLSDDSLRILAEDIQARGAAGQPGPAVPAAPAAH